MGARAPPLGAPHSPEGLGEYPRVQETCTKGQLGPSSLGSPEGLRAGLLGAPAARHACLSSHILDVQGVGTMCPCSAQRAPHMQRRLAAPLSTVPSPSPRRSCLPAPTAFCHVSQGSACAQVRPDSPPPPATIVDTPLFGKFLISPFFKKDFIYLPLERGEGREKEREISMCGCLSHGPHQGPGLQPRHVP